MVISVLDEAAKVDGSNPALASCWRASFSLRASYRSGAFQHKLLTLRTGWYCNLGNETKPELTCCPSSK
jgi:hypothetical protein